MECTKSRTRCSLVLRSCVLACSRTFPLAFSRAWYAYVLACLACFRALHACVLACLLCLFCSNVFRGYVLGVLVCLSCFTFQLLDSKTSYIDEFVGINTLNIFFIYFDINLRSYILKPVQRNQGSRGISLRSDTLKPI